jgi:hypothetical protein
MKFLRRQILERNRLTGNVGLYIDINNEVVIDKPYSLIIPRGTTAERSPDTSSPNYVNGMIRYNHQTGEFEGYQGGTGEPGVGGGSWRSFRFKEPVGIVVQTLNELGDGSTVIFGPLSPDPYTYTPQSGVTWNAAQIANNLIVLVENVFQIPNVNFTVIQNPAGNYGGNPGVDMPDGTYLQFSTAVPANKPVYVFHNFDR